MRTKVKFTALAALAFTLGVASCSDKIDEGQTPESNGNERYISVRIQEAPSAPASSAKANPATRADGGYESGNAMEGRIRNVRFYFFNNDGSPYSLTNSTPAGVNYLDYTVDNMTDAEGNPGTVERYTNTMVVIDGLSGTSPAYMVAVANPAALTSTSNANVKGTAFYPTTSLSRDQLTSVTQQTLSYRDPTSGDFLMTNSVYGDASSTYRLATPTDGHVKASRAEAISSPVDIYVERLAAKVTVSHPTTGDDAARWSQQTINGVSHTTYHLGYYAYNNNTDSVDVYAVIDGWGLADEQHIGKIFKDITGYNNATSGWRANIGFTPWNVAEYHRSFWEISPTFNALRNDNPIDYRFTAYNKQFSNITNQDTDACYTMPNTPEEEYQNTNTDENANRNTERTYRTKVLLAVHLMYRDASGNWQNAEISSYRGREYLGENAVKTQILSELQGHVTKADGAPLDASDIDFFAVDSQNVSQKSYQVVPQLDYTRDYALVDSAGNSVPTDWGTANQIMSRYANSAEIRKDGMAYYYTSIRHLSDTPGTLGYFAVVRNHWYRVNITGLKGWGTPVYNPDIPIIPITPSDQETFLAARINVLQWHIVSNDYNINGSTITNQ